MPVTINKEDETRIQERIDVALQREGTAHLAVVSVKLPTFWPNKIRYWLALAEAQFETSKMTVEKSKFNFVN